MAWFSYLALAVLLYSPAVRVYEAGSLPHIQKLRQVAYVMAPNWLLDGSSSSSVAIIGMLIYLFIAALAFGSWCWAMRTARVAEVWSLVRFLAWTAIIASPLLVLPGLVSDDVYLYNMYGRTIDAYGGNPILIAPSGFAGDPHLASVHWKDLPSAYGPIWLMLSAVWSGAAGNSLTAVVLVYRAAGLALHLAVTAALWCVLRNARGRAPMAALIFYAWNPLVLHEIVGNAHNDVLVAAFAVLLVAATLRARWLAAAFFGACALMVKPFAVLLLPALARRIIQQTHGVDRLRQLAITFSVVAFVVVCVSVPLWSGAALVRNAMDNPASHMYTNSLWELLSEAGPPWLGVPTIALQHPYLDVVRGLLFLAGAAWVLSRRSSRRDVPQVAMRLWLAFCLTACWVWPWYFVPALALAPLAGASHLPAATALTAGGLLFWIGWPEREVAPLQTVYFWRSLLLFGPVLLVLAWSPARALTLAALGVDYRRPRQGSGPVDVHLQTAPG